MEKYAGLSEITEKYLNGRLQKLVMEYETPEQLNLSVLYEDNNDYWYDYQIVIDSKKQKIDFLRHQPEGMLNHIDLLRDKDFETAVFKYLFTPSKLQTMS